MSRKLPPIPRYSVLDRAAAANWRKVLLPFPALPPKEADLMSIRVKLQQLKRERIAAWLLLDTRDGWTLVSGLNVVNIRSVKPPKARKADPESSPRNGGTPLQTSDRI